MNKGVDLGLTRFTRAILSRLGNAMPTEGAFTVSAHDAKENARMRRAAMLEHEAEQRYRAGQERRWSKQEQREIARVAAKKKRKK